MCGRYVLSMRPSQIRRLMQDQDMPVWDAPEDDADDSPRQSYNFAPGYHGVVYRADTPPHGAGPRHAGANEAGKETPEDLPAAARECGTASDCSITQEKKDGAIHYKLQTMKWGLIPFWTKRDPGYSSLMRTINCRSDSLIGSGGMWTTMKARKRCIVIADGFYEWLKTGPKDRLPHYIKRADGKPLLMAGLWDCVQYEGSDDKMYTYTIITTDSNPQLRFLHDRMPVILDPNSEKLWAWLDPARHEWSKELQEILKPFDGKLEIYPVSKEVGKVGNNSPSFIVPVASKENKSNIANFFAKGTTAKKESGPQQTASKKMEAESAPPKLSSSDLPSLKREASPLSNESQPPQKVVAKASPSKRGASKFSATSNGTKSPAKPKQGGSQKITKFFSSNS